MVAYTKITYCPEYIYLHIDNLYSFKIYAFSNFYVQRHIYLMPRDTYKK